MPAPKSKPAHSPRNGHASTAPDRGRLTEPTSTEPLSQKSSKPPLDDYTMFTKLRVLAEESGRGDLAEEFRRRAEAAPKPLPNDHVPPLPASTTPRVAKPSELAEAELRAKEGLQLLRANRLPEAMEKFRATLELNPDHHDAHCNLGVSLGRLGKKAEAELSFRQAMRVRPDFAPTHANLGAICLDQNKLDEAESAFREAIQRSPKESDFHRHLAAVMEARGQLAEAEASFRQAITLKRNDAEYHLRLGKLLMKAGRPAEAEIAFRDTTRLKPDQAFNWVHLAGSLEAQNQSAGAEAALRVAARLEPKNAEIHNNLGVALAAQGCWVEAESCYRKALEIDPKMAMAYNNLGNTLRTLERLDEGIASLQEAIRLQPKYAEAHNNLGIIFINQRKIPEGLACYEEALRLKPDYAEAHLNRSIMWLAAGDFERGWTEYEWRFRMKNRALPTVLGDRWDGSPLNGRTLLLKAEQGLGDVVQFMRYAPLIPRGSGGSIILECPEGLIDLAKTCRGIDQLVIRGQAGPKTDVFVPLLSVPGLLKTKLETIPAEIPYLSTDETRVAYWEQELSSIPGCRIGISWQGSLEHRGDRIRSVPLARFQTLAKMRGVTLCSIQKGPGTEQLTDGSAEGMQVHDFGARTQASFADSAALVQSLDLVVTVDTAVAHVAGALGVPVWVLVPCASDWRWLMQREDSPWYPTMRLFRQPKPGDWDSVFTRIAASLEQLPNRLRALSKRR